MADNEPTTAEATEEVLDDAVKETTEVAENVGSEVKDGDKTVAEGTKEISGAVEETAKDAATEIGSPELADQIADGLFRRLRDAGLLPPESNHETPSEAAHTAEHEAEAAPEKIEADSAPEAVHWWFRDIKLGRKSRV